MEMQLSQISDDETVTVTEIQCQESLRSRLRNFGMVPGTIVRCRYHSPDGGAAALELKETLIAMRTRDMKNILVRRA